MLASEMMAQIAVLIIKYGKDAKVVDVMKARGVR